MICVSISHELEDLVNKEIAITMYDGQAYRGKLSAFDHETIILTEVYEASTAEIDWRGEADKKSEIIKGYIPWRKITLPRVIMNMDFILRIWPWEVGEKKKASGKKKK